MRVYALVLLVLLFTLSCRTAPRTPTTPPGATTPTTLASATALASATSTPTERPPQATATDVPTATRAPTSTATFSATPLPAPATATARPSTATRLPPTRTPTATRPRATPTRTPPPGGLVPGPFGIALPAGFKVTLYASGLNQPTAMTFGPDRKLYVAQVGGGEIVEINPASGQKRVIDRGYDTPLGIAFRPGTNDLYISSTGMVTLIPGLNVAGKRAVIQHLPTGRHQNDAVVFGPDGKLYLPVGSTCDLCEEKDPRSATVMRFNPDGSGVEVFARGLRNTFDLAFHPVDGTLFGPDNSGDESFGQAIPDELNHIVQGGHYGWPDCWGYEFHPPNKPRGCEGKVRPVVELESHVSADGIAFYTGNQFPPEYKNNVFITEYGQEVPGVVAGHKVVRVQLSKTGSSYAGQVSDFATGIPRPLPIRVAPDGALLVGDFASGRIFRIVWQP